MGLFSLFSNDDAELAANQRNQGLQAGYDKLTTQFGAGRDALTSGFNQAGGYYKNLMDSTGAGAGAYGDATGANGAAGYGRATANFQANPGYQFQMDQGLQALNRTHAAAGNLSSGNADTDAMKFGTGLADQYYGKYTAGLLPYLGGQQTATAGAANTATGLGTALNSSFQGQGTAANANDTAQGASSAAATMNNYNVGSNMWNGIMGAAKLAAGIPGGGNTFGGTPGSPIGGSFGGTSYGGPNGPTPTSGGLFSTFSGA